MCAVEEQARRGLAESRFKLAGGLVGRFPDAREFDPVRAE